MKKVILSSKDQQYLEMMEDLNEPNIRGKALGLKSRLHDKQIECLLSLYKHKKNLIMAACGRKFGKTDLSVYALWRHAMLNPGSACYYIGPEATHARKIVWDKQRVQKFLGKNSSKYIKSTQNVLMKVMFKNGSFIQVMGSDNWQSANGLDPDFVVYDEFKAFNHRWHTEFNPNRVANRAPLLIIGTLPKVGDSNKEEYESVLEYAKTDPANCAVHLYSTFDNPIMSRDPETRKGVEREIAILRQRGEEDVVQREYYSKIIPGGSKAIFPMLNEKTHIRPQHEILNEIKRDLKKLEWFCVTDPGTTTCFAGLIGCVNPYTRKVYLIDEIYEKDQSMTSVRMMYPRLEIMMKKYNPHGNIHDDWVKVFDEAAAWFSNEVMQQYGVYFMPTEKHVHKKESGLSLIKDVLIHDLLVISDSCGNLFKEMQEYAKDDKGNIPKRNDHLIDCLRYLFGASNYNMVEALETVRVRHPEEDMRKGRRGTRRGLLQDIQAENTDWTDDWDIEW
jgi:hypothetical protein